MPTISLCMIVKNEEKVLSRCLDSVKHIVDEIIVVDTGSTDRTKEIAASFGAKVFDFQWKSDFSAARQFAKDQATSEWILQLDADEYLLPQEAVKVRQEIEKTEKLGIAVRIINVMDEKSTTVSHIFTRIYKNIPEIQYRYKIHEQIVLGGEILKPGLSAIKVMHTGYEKKVTEEKNKRERNLKILREELKKEPNNGFMNFNIANEYLAVGNYQDALEAYQKAYKFGQGKGYQSKAILNIVQILADIKEFEKALAVIQDAKQVYPDYTDLLFTEGWILEQQGRISEAKVIYEACLNTGDAKGQYIAKEGMGTTFPLERLAVIALRHRQYEEAMNYLMINAKLDKYNEKNMLRILSILRKTSTDQEIMGFLNELYTDDAQDNLMKFTLTHRHRLSDLAAHYYSRIENISQISDMESNYYINFYTKQFETNQTLVLNLLEGKEEDAAFFAILHAILANDEIVANAVKKQNKTAKLILEAAEGQAQWKKGAVYDWKLYVAILGELAKLKEYKRFEQLLSIQEAFTYRVFKEIGDIFYANYTDELAIDYYDVYLSKNEKDTKVLNVIAELLYNEGDYENATVFAEKSFNLNPKNFRPVEIMIESLEKLSIQEGVDTVVRAAATVYPDSSFLAKRMK